MSYFIGGILLLVLGYLTYGRLVELILAPDDRLTPGNIHPDGVDYVILPKWRNMLIQLLNIAGVGPVIGVILGIKFGEIVFLIIPLGNIIGGAVHDFIGGMMSIRSNGANLTTLVRQHLGEFYYKIFMVFMTVLLLLVVAVFITTPAQLIDAMIPSCSVFWLAVVVIFIYYIVATLFPVDKIIGKIYPFFGLLLLLGTAAIFFALVFAGISNPSLFEESAAFAANMWTAENQHPVLPLLFVTIACGILSGFHATQSPIVARTMNSEREAKATFYGMMVVEGIIGMVWAAGGMAIYNLFPDLMSKSGPVVLAKICSHFLGTWGGALALIAVIVLAITSGDTALRSLRLSLAEAMKINQTKTSSRVLVTLPLIVLVTGLLWWSSLSAKSFNFLWNYFAWGNQVLAVSTLFAGMVWLRKEGKNWFIAAVPACFMCFVVIEYILWISPAHKGPLGFGMELDHAAYFAFMITLLLFVRVLVKGSEKEISGRKQ